MDKFIGLSGNENLIVLDLVSYEYNPEIGPVIFLKSGTRKYGFCFCHRRKDRSTWFFGLERVFCSRCLGMLLGGIAGLLCVISHVRVDPAWSLLVLLPMLLDGFLQLVRERESTNGIRLVTGFLFGVGLPLFLAVCCAVLKDRFFFW